MKKGAQSSNSPEDHKKAKVEPKPDRVEEMFAELKSLMGGLSTKVDASLAIAQEAKTEAVSAKQAALETTLTIASLEDKINKTNETVATVQKEVEDIQRAKTTIRRNHKEPDSDIRDKQVLALGFKERMEPDIIIAKIEAILTEVLGDSHTAKVEAGGNRAKMGIITFEDASHKIDFYKKMEPIKDKEHVKPIFFRNNSTTEERTNDKLLGYTKFHLTRKGHVKDEDIKI
eukprot:8702792-Pyramimonas_sp.AAC.1